jgi:HlyD family secretion protein
VIFFVPEHDLSLLHLNAKVSLSSDGNPTWASGTIRYISKIAQYTPPNLFSRDERHQLVFRVEAGIDKPQLNHIHLGEPVTLELLQ